MCQIVLKIFPGKYPIISWVNIISCKCGNAAVDATKDAALTTPVYLINVPKPTILHLRWNKWIAIKTQTCLYVCKTTSRGHTHATEFFRKGASTQLQPQIVQRLISSFLSYQYGDSNKTNAEAPLHLTEWIYCLRKQKWNEVRITLKGWIIQVRIIYICCTWIVSRVVGAWIVSNLK